MHEAEPTPRYIALQPSLERVAQQLFDEGKLDSAEVVRAAARELDRIGRFAYPVKSITQPRGGK